MRNILSLLGALLAIGSVVPYLIDIIKRKTRPNIVSWITWTILTAIATAAAFAAHEPRSAILTLATSLGTLSVVLLGLKYGIAKFTLFDGICQTAAIIGLILWFVFNSPLIALVASLGVDFIGLLPTLRHSWLKPGEETWQAFGIAFFASAFTIASIKTFTVTGLLFPVYLTLADGSLALMLIYRRRHLNLKRVDK